MRFTSLLILPFFLAACHSAPRKDVFIYSKDTDSNLKTVQMDLGQWKEESKFREGDWVETDGYLQLDFENVAIFKNRAEIKTFNTQNALWLNFSDNIIPDIELHATGLRDRKVRLRGKLNLKDKGHLGAYQGSLDSVYWLKTP